jgi:uncharacterized LabA/DUF88 family protein
VSKNVAVFVDVANIFYAAKAAGADIDYVTLLKAAVAGRDFVRAYAYTGLDPENENQRNFHSFLARHGYKVVSKDIRKYGDGKVKANLDIELVVDMMKTARNLDVAIVVSGDGDFAPAIRAVQEMGVRVEVISFRGNTSSDLIEVADVFYDITQLARVDRDSSRSGRRVASDDEDLSMTEVPDKQTEGRGGRGRGRGRGRGGRAEVAEEVAVADTRSSRPTARGVAARTEAGPGGRLVVLPGEKLSRAAGAAAGEAAGEAALVEAADELAAGVEVEATEGAVGAEIAEAAETTGRRRRRRGGRGRGHGRAQAPGEAGEGDLAEPDEGDTAAPPAARPNQFGSVWDSQIGMAGRPEQIAPVSPDEDDYAEPEIPEYLLAERRRSSGRGGGGRGQGGGGRGVRSAYASDVDRERYGRSSTPRYAEPVRQAQPQRRRDERPQRAPGPQQHRGGGAQRGGRDSAEPWSEVPPELEELLRAQLATKLTRPAAGEARQDQDAAGVPAAQAPEVGVQKAPARRGGRRKPAESASAERTAESTGEGEAPAEKTRPASRGRRKPADSAAAGGNGLAGPSGSAGSGAEAGEPAAGAGAPRRRAPVRRKAAASPAQVAEAISDGSEGGGE